MSENNNEMPSENKNQRNNRTTLLIILIVLLVGVNIFLYIKLNNKTADVTTLTEKIATDSVSIKELDNQYEMALNDIERLKGQNTGLDSLLQIRENEIKNLKSALDASKKNGKISKAEYEKKIGDLLGMINDLKAQITELEVKNNILVAQKDSLGKNLDQQIQTNTKLSEDLKVKSKKVAKGSLLKPSNMTASGVRTKGKGKEVEANSKKATQIRVCFDVGGETNSIAEAGSKTFYLRIISPGRVTLAVQSAGSGVITLSEGTGEVQYTTSKKIDYNLEKQNVCIYWSGTFDKGKYTTEIYQDGYMIGTKDFELK